MSGLVVETGLATPWRLISTADANNNLVATGRRTLYTIAASNINASPRYLKFFDKATAPAAGTDTPVLVFLIPGNAAGAGIVHLLAGGWNFNLGLGLCLVTGMADSSSTGVAAADICVSLGYR